MSVEGDIEHNAVVMDLKHGKVNFSSIVVIMVAVLPIIPYLLIWMVMEIWN